MSCDLNTARSESDLELIKRAQKGDCDAFASLFHSHKARIYSVCLRMTNNTAEAEDLTQDAFLQVFRKLATFRGDSALSTWLYRIAVNTVLMHFRKKALKQVSLDEPFNQDAKLVRREYGSKDGRLVGSVDRIALSRAIKELPDGYRTIFLLHEVEGYEHQEIAELLDCSVGNSKSQLHKAKLRIRELLGHPKVETRADNLEFRSSSRPRAASKSDSPSEAWTTSLMEEMAGSPAMVPSAPSQFVATNA
ncbi:MAG: sigma-24, subfamily [Acidobacteriaceae bacterium]|nr:sigma-24, subfamily [Acidobacteriaceae bacterium]